MIRRDNWTESRRKVWAEAVKQKPHSGADVWHFIHPDDRLPRVVEEPPASDDDLAMKTYRICSIWLHPITIYNSHGTIPETKALRVYDGRNDDTFYVSREVDVWVKDQLTASTTPATQSTKP